jgi:4-amino-4-deoxy-L-arabinose transferase-like glycosyltransferase
MAGRNEAKAKKEELENSARISRGFFSLLGVLLILIGLILIYASPADQNIVMPRPLWLSLGGVALFVFAASLPPGRLTLALSKLVSLDGSWAWTVGAVILSALATVTVVAFEQSYRTNYLPALMFWFGAAFCYLIGHRGKFRVPSWDECLDWLRSHRSELIMIGAVVLLGAVLRFNRLGLTPRVINGDEGRLGLAAQATDTSMFANPFALWENFGAFYLDLVNLAIKAFGATPLALRLLPALGGILAIPMLYLFARALVGKRVALISAALLTISHTHMHFSRSGAVGYIQDTWLVPLELYLLYTGIDRRSSLRTALAGVLLGIHYSIYLTSQMVTGLILIFLLVALLFFFRSWLKPALRQVGVFWGGFAIMILPEAWYIWQHPLVFIERMAKDGTFASGWMAQQIANTGQSAIQILAGRVLHAFLSLIYYPSFDFYGSSIPMFSMISACLFLIGMALVLFRRQTPATVMLNGAFWAFPFAIGIFAIPPSADTYRMLVAFPAAVIMSSIGLDELLTLIGLGWQRLRLAYATVTAALLFSLTIFNLWTYYDDFAGRCLFGENLAGRFASYLGNYARTVDRGFTIYLLNDEFIFYGSHDSATFLAQGRSILNFPNPVDQLSLVSGESVVAAPSRAEELRQWVLRQAEGELDYFFDCQNPIILVYRKP